MEGGFWKALGALALSLFDVSPKLILGVIFVMIIDGVAGIWHSIRKGDKIKSTILASTVTKAIVYSIGISISLVVSNSGYEVFALVDDLIISAILFTELVSVLGHLAFLHKDWARVNKFARTYAKNYENKEISDALDQINEVPKPPEENG